MPGGFAMPLRLRIASVPMAMPPGKINVNKRGQEREGRDP
jgi:hypothetical protein